MGKTMPADKSFDYPLILTENLPSVFGHSLKFKYTLDFDRKYSKCFYTLPLKVEVPASF